MAWSDLLIFWPGILGVACMALSKLPDLLDLIESCPGQASFERYWSDAGRRGLTYADASRKLEIRETFAKLRRETSDAVLANVGNWKPILDANVERCLADNPQHAREIVAMMAGQTYGCVLSPMQRIRWMISIAASGGAVATTRKTSGRPCASSGSAGFI